MLLASVTRWPRRSMTCAALRMRERSEGPEDASTAMCACSGSALGRLSISKARSEPVSRILFPLRGEDHSSVTRVAAVIKQPTRKLVTGTGGPITSLFGLAPQGVYRAVAAHA